MVGSRVGNWLIVFLSESLVFCEKKSEWAICYKNWAIRSFAYFWWATSTWANCSWSLIFGERPERFSQLKKKKNPAEHQGLIKIICSPSKSRETIPLNHPITSEFICIFTLWMGASSEFQSKHLFLQSKLCVPALPHSKFCFVFLYCFPQQKLLHS